MATRVAQDETLRILHGAIGCGTEAGELLDAVKRYIFYGKPIDRTNIIEELGDIEWYMAIIRDVLNVSQEEVQQLNISKLQKRFPEKFTEADAIDRDLQAERDALEGRS